MNRLICFIRDHFGRKDSIPLHAPKFCGNEQKYLTETIETSFVSSVGFFVDQFEKDIEAYTSAKKAVATMNGTAALHIALKLVGVKFGDLVLTQPLTFVATCNAISYCGAEPIFIDVDKNTLGLSADALESWLNENAQIDESGICRNRLDSKIIRACVPMHTFGHPADIDGLLRVTKKWNIQLVEDSAESLGSFYKGKHVGTLGQVGVLSFNGNKIITTGGGGMILTDTEKGKYAKHLTTTAKKTHAFEYIHDEIGFNYRLPNLNAALGCAQLEQITSILKAKRTLAMSYKDVLAGSNLIFVNEPKDCHSNFWLNAVICEDQKHRDYLLQSTNEQGIMTRPIWALMNNLTMYRNCRHGDLSNAEWLESRVVNLPSSVI